MKKIYFHIGLPKTGTSFLQSTFAFNESLYAENGLNYPDLSGNFDDAIAGKTTGGNGMRLAATELPELLKTLKPHDFNELLDSFSDNFDYLISSEWLSECSLDFFEKIIKIFSNKFTPIFILFVRNPINKISSNYLQCLKFGLYSKDIQYYLDDLIEKEKKYLIMIDRLPGVIKILNYDICKNNLIDAFDEIIFGRKLSIVPPRKIVNPSPNYHQSQILKLVNQIKISNFKESMLYIEGAGSKSLRASEFQISQLLCEKIEEKLSVFVDQINKILPRDQHIFFSYPKNNCENNLISFSENDVKFIQKLIVNHCSLKIKESFDFIIYSASKANLKKYPALPNDFNVIDYLLHNPDLVDNKINPVHHYLKHGKFENRIYK